MALLGTLADFSVDDILGLLATTRKTGVLVVDGGGRSGRVWLDAGHVVGAQSGSEQQPGTVVFELLRLVEGRFAFEDGAAPQTLGAPAEVPQVVAEARAKLEEWRDIERVVPSMTAFVSLNADGPGGEHITIGADEWRTVAAVGPGGAVAEVAARLGVGEFDACRAVKAVVDAGLATVSPGTGAPVTPTGPAGSATPSRDDLVRQLSQLRGG